MKLIFRLPLSRRRFVRCMGREESDDRLRSVQEMQMRSNRRGHIELVQAMHPVIAQIGLLVLTCIRTVGFLTQHCDI